MTISPQTTLNNVKMYVKQKLSHDFSGHDMAHIERVVKLAQKILNHQPQANAFIVLMSAYLHDVIDEKVTEDVDSAIIELKEYLRSLKLTSAEISAIFDIIENMSYRKNLSQKATLSLEGQIVQDADRLDAIGAIGIGRTFYYGGNKHNIMHDPNVPPRIKLDENNYKQTNTVINHFYEKLFLLKDMMNTDTAKQMAEQRHEILVKFVNQFEQEWLGID
ncbi:MULTISPECIES: HD domain-containing protein [unclassified Gilliamella]|uniref:HD domain-containing protein n=1 Tax=unclassified Gilliamella TaxID=2685620 RepID=UPI001C6A17FA|nr:MULTISPECIES: HD domain-containing protein [unclassified Gilliamella]MCX8583900.1 HD domain-containing protein [Gilliamella sp. B3372]MCX8585432.1 HD domain-containing protein [Gilliamella sp. B3562]MCX8594567.1 HD domain-containing protein [Gilliamella sp. B3367]MCX8662068.1 HD domain-containing protein [Gilliamella sp. B2911]MCX8682752.1 HD domain-containing protein [Gilliamella sp. B2889]